MERDVPMCHLDATVEQAVEVLDAHPGWQRCVVVNDVGIVAGGLARDAGGIARPVVDAMRPGPSTIRPDEPLDEVRQRMRKHHTTELIVTDPTGRVLGALRDHGT